MVTNSGWRNIFNENKSLGGRGNHCYCQFAPDGRASPFYNSKKKYLSWYITDKLEEKYGFNVVILSASDFLQKVNKIVAFFCWGGEADTRGSKLSKMRECLRNSTHCIKFYIKFLKGRDVTNTGVVFT